MDREKKIFTIVSAFDFFTCFCSSFCSLVIVNFSLLDGSNFGVELDVVVGIDVRGCDVVGLDDVGCDVGFEVIGCDLSGLLVVMGLDITGLDVGGGVDLTIGLDVVG